LNPVGPAHAQPALPDLLASALAALRKRIRKALGNGACLFNALSILLYRDESQAVNLRLKALNYILDHHQEFEAVWRCNQNQVTCVFNFQ
jgi:hypothetical protein